MPNRNDLIEMLTRYELECLLDNPDKHTLCEVTEFFANGGFNTWTTENLNKKYELFIKEEQNA